jgi:catecholate siderophore receptor
MMAIKNRSNQRIAVVAKTALLSVSYLALATAGPIELRAQTSSPAQQAPAAPSEAPPPPPATPAQEAPASQPATPSSPAAAPASKPSSGEPGEAPLPPVTVYPPRQKPKSRTTEQASGQNAAQPTTRRPAKPTGATPIAMSPIAVQAAWPASGTQAARTGEVGVYQNSTSAVTKVNTPLVNIPQSLSIITKNFIADNAFQNITDATRYVPGVAVHQGEGNRDELIIRGVDSSANFFVNGFRDDVQYFRDFYNAQSVEILKGPSAIMFGRASGGGLLNRTLKEADGQRVYDATVQSGSWLDRRATVDVGQAVNENFAARLNMMYEKSDEGFRSYNWLERYGVNPTFTYKLGEDTKLRFSYEYFHDNRTADRGNPSQASMPGGSTKQNPGFPFAPGGDLQQFYGDPFLNVALANVHTFMGFIEHDFGNGLTMKNGTYYAQFDKFYQNVYPGNGPLAGAVNTSVTTFNRAAYNHTTNRENVFNDTDFFYKMFTGPFYHSIAFGSEFGHQDGIDVRNSGIFPNGTTTILANPFSPGYFDNIDFTHLPSDSNSKYRLDLQSGYVRDAIDLTSWLQVIGALRYDRFDESALDMNIGKLRTLTNDFLSPQGAVILKPAQNMSIYTSYMVSYLPASGDQFSALGTAGNPVDGTVILKPQKFTSEEVGFKWNIAPRLLYTAAVYNLDRENVPLPDPNNPGFFILSGKNRIRGFESELKGFVTDAWQSWLGYAYTDARVNSDTSTTILPGNRIQLVPYHQFSWWNKYQFTSVWAASLGVIYFSDSFASSDDTVVLPGYVRFDAGVFATIDEHWKAQLNVENLFNTGYWATADGNNNISPGQGRTIRVKLTAKL